jgi:prevent-host-death family protein
VLHVYASVMTVTVGVRKFRENLSHYLEIAKEGREVVVITDRGEPIARLEGPSNLERLIAEGRVRPAKRPKRPSLPLDGPELEPPYLSDVVIEGRGG